MSASRARLASRKENEVAEKLPSLVATVPVLFRCCTIVACCFVLFSFRDVVSIENEVAVAELVVGPAVGPPPAVLSPRDRPRGSEVQAALQPIFARSNATDGN